MLGSCQAVFEIDFEVARVGVGTSFWRGRFVRLILKFDYRFPKPI
jgi:hypothetical protein